MFITDDQCRDKRHHLFNLDILGRCLHTISLYCFHFSRPRINRNYICARGLYRYEARPQVSDLYDVSLIHDRVVAALPPVSYRTRREFIHEIGHSVLLPILDSLTSTVKVFLPKRYCDVISDEDIEEINSKRVILYLNYSGTCVNSYLYIMAIQKQEVS